MKFTDSHSRMDSSYSPRRLDYILAGAGHLLVLAVGLITFSSSADTPSRGDNAIMISMVTASSSSEVSSVEVTSPQEIQEEAIEELVSVEDIHEEEVVEEPDFQEDHEIPVEENPEETDDQEIPEEITQENPPEENHDVTDDFVSVSGEGSAGTGAPGPGTYESRVFNAVRRGYRTSVEPERSYRIVLTVNPDGSTSIEVIRKSGTSAFDRAVENALSIAQIPPMPPGRSTPAIINIEFLGPEQ